jgi:hypothetical protein
MKSGILDQGNVWIHTMSCKDHCTLVVGARSGAPLCDSARINHVMFGADCIAGKLHIPAIPDHHTKSVSDRRSVQEPFTRQLRFYPHDVAPNSLRFRSCGLPHDAQTSGAVLRGRIRRRGTLRCSDTNSTGGAVRRCTQLHRRHCLVFCSAALVGHRIVPSTSGMVGDAHHTCRRRIVRHLCVSHDNALVCAAAGLPALLHGAWDQRCDSARAVVVS